MMTMKMSSLLCLFLLLILNACTPSSSSASVSKVQGQVVVPDKTPAVNFRVTLNGNEFVTMTDIDGTFAFHNVPSGIYLLDVHSLYQMYPQFKLKVDSENGTINAVEYKYPGAKRLPAAYPLVVTALIPISYFQQRPPFSILGMLWQNPMITMMVGMFGLMLLFPQMLEGLDPEKMKEMQAEMGDAGDPMKQMSKLFGMSQDTKNDDDDE